MRKEVEESIRMIKHSFVEGTFVRLNINTGEEIPLTADMCLEPIIKDLEVLDILKPYFNKLHNGYLIDEIFLDDEDTCKEAKEEYQKIKEWLEE